ncbi:DUF484 family protein [Gilvimarinus sp. F26214L]|uniref:DUF484 family protein n=1 Tax=Gilvimarinus sp. DZF01 TaxID=3461371 RepID=UPI0040453BF9
MTEQTSDTSPNAEEVCAFLRENQDFFVQHPELLEDINLPHDSGSAVSLVERQVAILRERNIEMRYRLGKLLDNARENDKLFDKTKGLVLNLLEGRSLPELVENLLRSFDRDFGIPYTSLVLFGDSSRLPESGARVCGIHQARDSVGRILTANKTLCGDFPREELEFLFPGLSNEIGSAAVVPLVHGNCFGLLAVANSDPNYYRSTMGTLFLGYIGEVLNRMLPRYLAG